MDRFRIGIGYDIHRFAPRRKLFIGGVEIPYKKGLLGHSDADILLHALCDALLGASAEGDIGQLFPDNDPKYKDISSLELLKKVQQLLAKRSLEVGNIDVMLLLEAPKIAAFKEKMKRKIARILRIDTSQVSIKATTNEGAGEIGRGQAAAAHVVVLLRKMRGNP
jgi:2-C-methyl-D-erythritol 2,4-cyclodiphosphate synthase